MSDAPTWSALGVVPLQCATVEQRVACPRCARGDRDDALGINTESGAFHCFRCGWKGRAGGDVSAAANASVTAFDDPNIAKRKRERLRATWRESVALDDPKAHAIRRYLAARGLDEILRQPPKTLRAHPALGFWDGAALVDRFPALVALLHGANGDPVTLHATFLSAAGCTKAPVRSPKKILGVAVRGATRGGAIHLYEPHRGVLGVAEGIETALSLHLIAKIPTWATFCADNLERVRLPADLRELRIGVDVDANGKGEQVARALAARARKWKRRLRVILVTPEIDGPGDLNDELRRRVQ